MGKFDEILNSSDASDALLGEQIDKLQPYTMIEYGTITTNKGTIDTANTFCAKVGKIVSFRVRIIDTIVTGNWYQYALLPFKPANPTVVFESNSPTTINSFTASIDGSISRYAKSETATTFDISGTYITND